MSRGSNKHVHYDDEVNTKKHQRSHSRRQRRRRRVSRRAKIYGAAFLLALTGCFCLVPGTSLTVVAFTNGTNSRENILKLLGPVFGGVGLCLVSISIGLVCYAIIKKRKSRKKKELRHLGYPQEVDNSGYQASVTRDGTLSAEVRLLDVDKEPSAHKVQHTLISNHHGQGVHRQGVPVDDTVVSPSSMVIVDIIHPPPSVTVSMVGQGKATAAIALSTPEVPKESFQTDSTYEENPDVDSNVHGFVKADREQCGAAATLDM